jgi:nucleoid-associated protein YgaU
MDIPVMFDDYREGGSVESDIARLNQMSVGSDLVQPPTVKIDGALPIKGNTTWIITEIEWGTNVYWQQDGEQPYRARQDAVVKVTQYNPTDKLVVHNSAHPNQYTTKVGDTLRKIAQKMYDDPTKWQKIANAQTPRLRVMGTAVLKTGTRLRIPR